MQKRILSLIVLASLAAPLSSAATYFLPGVSESGGWHDAEKQWGGVDDNMCWAAQAACMTQYWQDWFVKAGNTLPDGTPTGYGASNRQDRIPSSNIFEFYKDNWTNVGGLAEFSIPWYFTGSPDPEYYRYGYHLQNGWSKLTSNTHAGFFSDQYSGVDDYMTKEPFMEHRFGQNMYIDDFTETLMRLITEDYSVVGLSITFWNLQTGETSGHAVTLWGFELDEAQNEVSAIYITDSDDDIFGLVRYEVDGHANLGYDVELPEYLEEGLRGKYDVAIDSFYSLSVADFVVAIPEPSSFGLLAGVVALGAGACARRRRRS